jgi:hypothetical protein
MGTTSATTVWRSRSGLLSGVTFGAFVALIGLTQIGRPASKGGGAGVAVVAFVIAAALIVLAARVAVVTSDRGVRVRNPVRTIDIPWSDVVRFRLGQHKLLSQVCLVDLVDGGSQYAFGIQVARASGGTKERRMIELLNEMVAAKRRPEPSAVSHE